MKIVLLYGGQSAEHDISLISAHNIMQSIMYNYYEVQPVYITKQGDWLKGAPLSGPLSHSNLATLRKQIPLSFLSYMGLTAKMGPSKVSWRYWVCLMSGLA